MTDLPEEWTEVALVGITRRAASAEDEVQFASLTDSIEIDWGAKEIEQTALINGGRVTTYKPEEPSEIKLTLIPVGTISEDASSSPTGLYDWFMGGTTVSADTTSTINSRTRHNFRVTVLWCTTLPSTASGATADATSALRLSFWDCKLTKVTANFSDDLLKCEATFKCVPYNKSASGLIKADEANNSALAALGDYTDSSNTPS